MTPEEMTTVIALVAMGVGMVGGLLFADRYSSRILDWWEGRKS